MTTASGTSAPDGAPHSIGLLDDEGRQLAAACLTGAALGSWPAFTLGVYGVVFFEQHLALWAAATSVFLALGLSKGVRVWVRPRTLALLLPSLCILLAWILPVGGTSGIYQLLFWFGGRHHRGRDACAGGDHGAPAHFPGRSAFTVSEHWPPRSWCR